MSHGQKKLIVSFHDLHPGSWDCCRRFIERSRLLGARNMSLLIIPRYHGQAPFTENVDFLKWLQDLPEQDFDLCLHGFHHQAESAKGNWRQRLTGNVYTNAEGEFYQLSHAQAREKLTQGLRLFKDHGLNVYGFTAPAWLVSEEAKAAIRKSGFLYHTLWDKVALPPIDLTIKAPTLVYSSRNAWRRFVSKLWIPFFHGLNKNAHILRLAVHPIDFEYPDIESHLYGVLEKALRTRATSTYRDLVPVDMQNPVSIPAS